MRKKSSAVGAAGRVGRADVARSAPLLALALAARYHARMRRSPSILPAVATLATLALVGCSRERPHVAAPMSPPPSPVPMLAASPDQRDAVARAAAEQQGGGLSISAEILALCPGIKPPKFGYDSAELRGEWQAALRTLSDCMRAGKLADRTVLLTGHTDPRGEDDYNLALGGRRAESVKRAIVAFGVEGARVDVTSRGEVDAAGTDEDGWSRDRKVDIDLKQPPRVSSAE